MSRRPLRQLDAVRALLPILAMRISAELMREREAQKFRDLFESSPGAIHLVDAHYTIRMSNGAANHLFGWDSQALDGQKASVLSIADRIQADEALFRHLMAGKIGDTIDTGLRELWGRRRDGSVFQVQIQICVLATAHGGHPHPGPDRAHPRPDRDAAPQ
jgi:PAS domain S-box-containing protein